MWLLGRLAPDHKTIADFRKDNGLALGKVCARFVELCREMGLLAAASVAIDGSKFKAVNNRDKNFTKAKVERRRAQLEESVARYLSQLDTADRQEPTDAVATKVTRLTEKLTKLKEEVAKLAVYEKQMLTSPDQQTLPNRSGQPFDGDERPRLGRRRLQRAGRRGHRQSPDHRPRGDEQRLGSGATRQYGRAGEGCIADQDPRGRCRSRLLQQPGESSPATRPASR